jgi:hypothetical protein
LPLFVAPAKLDFWNDLASFLDDIAFRLLKQLHELIPTRAFISTSLKRFGTIVNAPCPFPADSVVPLFGTMFKPMKFFA